MYKSYQLLRPLVIFAGTIGILQALAWIALSVVSIVAYYCQLDFVGMGATLGTIEGLTLFQMYFHGECTQAGLPEVDFSPLNSVKLAQPFPVHICSWIYLSLSILWFVSSITLLTSVRYINFKYANIYLYIWIFITLAVSTLDLGLGVVFALDYDTLRRHSYTINIAELPAFQNPQFLILTAKSMAGIIMTICFRGFTIWLVNVALAIYFFRQTFKITDYNRIKKAILNPAFASTTSSLQRNQTIDAFDPKNNYWIGTTTFSTQDGSSARKSAAVELFEERKNHYDAQQQLQMSRQRADDNIHMMRHRNRDNVVANVVKELNHRHSHNSNSGHVNKGYRSTGEPNVPAPDYSPTMPRVNGNPALRSAMRSSRY